MTSRGYPARTYEWPTFCLLIFTYVAWAALTLYAQSISIFLSVLLLAPILTLHSSLQHETVHILEPRWKTLGPVLVFPALGLFIPYIRFRDSHIAHHQNENLTDPYDDPESFYLVPEVWERIPPIIKRLLMMNNTLAGRLVFGPLIGQIAFMYSDWKLIKSGDRAVVYGWLIHIPAVASVLIWLATMATIPVWAYMLSCYFGLSILKIRTFLEHQAHEKANERSVIIEDRGVLALLFLNNNYHAVHHAHPQIPWYNLPAFYKTNRKRFLKQNHGYQYPNYRTVFLHFFLCPKEPVVHPIWSLGNRRDR